MNINQYHEVELERDSVKVTYDSKSHTVFIKTYVGKYESNSVVIVIDKKDLPAIVELLTELLEYEGEK